MLEYNLSNILEKKKKTISFHFSKVGDWSIFMETNVIHTCVL